MMILSQENNRCLTTGMIVSAVVLMVGSVGVVHGQEEHPNRGGNDGNYGNGEEHQCILDCDNGSQCIFGPASYYDHQTQDGTTLDFEFHQIDSVDNMHCDCPLQYTGLHCEVPFASCDDNHKCYHGGECIQGLIDIYGNGHNFCDCSNAFDAYGNQFIGKYCEEQATQFCDSSETTFCLNGGQCNHQYPSFGTPCLCAEGYTGNNCEYHDDKVPECSLKCENGGYCNLDGTKHISKYDLWDDDEYPNQYCECPEGWDGRHCEISSVPCGDNYCFHGSTCMTGVIGGQIAHHCDCTDSYTNDRSYAGLYCQYEATTFCTKNPNLNGDLFCVNGGTCSRTDVTDGCDCLDGFTGFSCEFLDPEIYDTDNNGYGVDPNNIPTTTTETNQEPLIVEQPNECVLDCYNDGTCRFGKKDTGYLNGIGENTMHLNDTHTNFMHCVCPDGYTGIQCEHAIEVCPSGANDESGNEHVCLHGSTCGVEDNNEQDNNSNTCDCSTTNSNLSNNFAGEHCEHPVNDVCTDSEPAPGQPLSFCVNQGTCISRIKAGDEHPGCLCKDGFTGPHCELHENTQMNAVAPTSETLTSTTSTTTTNTGGGGGGGTPLQTTAVVLSIVAILGVMLLTINSYLNGRKRQRLDATSLSLEWGSMHPQARYTDKPVAIVNLAPKRGYVDDQYMSAISGGHHRGGSSTGSTSPTPPHHQNGLDGSSSGGGTSSTIHSSTDPFTTAHITTSNGAPGEPDLQVRPDPPLSPQIYIGPPRDEDGHELHNVEIA